MDDQDKLFLKELSLNLEFHDDVTAFRCVHCGKLAIDHFICDCNHVYCDICPQIHADEMCPFCCLPMSLVTRQDPSFEEVLSQLTAYCPNRKNGCKTMPLLIEISGHLKRCKHVTPTSTASGSKTTKQINTREGILSNGSPIGHLSHPDQLLGQAAHNPQSLPYDFEMFRHLLESFGDLTREPRTFNQTMTQSPHSFRAVPRPVPIRSQRFKAEPGKDYNVLLLGATGIGKSTFINAFTNYSSFKNLDDALKKDPIALIPTQFSVPDENYQQRTVRCGSDPNEDMKTNGQSATQSCKAYEFPLDGFKLRIIDTPGIGDTRGIVQDRKNVHGIVNFLSDYDDLDAICILLKPNEPRLTPQFSFCMNELLSRLHTNASKNIIFIFTNSRTTFYRPGDTATPLKALLDKIRSTPPYPNIPYDKDNIICFDNEAFRFLVAHKNGIHFSKEDHLNFSQSWIKSVEESKRMIRYIVEGPNGRGLTPHRVQDTLRVNQARDAIMELVRPLSVLSKSIKNHLQVLGEHTKGVEDCKDDEDQLKAKLYIPFVTIDIVGLTQPRMVCASAKCREAHQVGNQVQYHYRQVCLDPCDIAHLRPNVIGHRALRNCYIIDSRTAHCKRCGCHYSLHLQIYYQTQVVTTQVVDSDVDRQLRNKARIRKASQDILRHLEVGIKNYAAEEKILTDCADKLAVFLKHNAMVVHNDAFKDYLNEIIDDEKCGSESGSRNAETIKGLKNMLDDYELEKGILEKALNNPTSQHDHITNADVGKIINDISNMKISCVNFKRAKPAKKKAKGRRYRRYAK